MTAGKDLEPAGDDRHDEQSDGEEEDEQVRHGRRDEKMPAANGDAVKEDDAHGVFKHGKRERAEKKHRREQQAAQRVAMGEERPQLLHQSTGMTRDDEFQILA